jgi:hypothetical protein
MQGQAANRQRQAERRLQRRRRTSFHLGRTHLGRGLRIQRHVPPTGTHGQTGPFHHDLEPSVLSGSLIGIALVAEEVVAAVVEDDPFEPAVQVVGVDERESAGFISQRHQAILRQQQFMPEA